MGPEVTRLIGEHIAAIPDTVKWILGIGGGGLVAYMFKDMFGKITQFIIDKWKSNTEKFYNEYSDILTHLIVLADTVEYIAYFYGTLDLLADHGVREALPAIRRKIDDIMGENPVKIEDDLIDDWDDTKELISQFRREYQRSDEGFSEDRFYTKQKNALEKVKWLENKVENYYTCHFHRRLLYRIKDWFNLNPYQESYEKLNRS